MKLVWYQWVSFVELFVTRRGNPEGFSSAIEIFRQEAAQICREELGSSACGLKYPRSLNLPVLAQQNLQWDLQHFVLQPQCFAAQPWGNHSISSVLHGWIRIYLPGLQLLSSCVFSVGHREPEKLQAAKPSLEGVCMCLAVQVGGDLMIGLVKSR